MCGIFFLFLLIVAGIVAARYYFFSRSRAHVHDPEGRRITPGAAADAVRTAGIVGGSIVVLLLLLTSFRVVPVGHALVIFNTVTQELPARPAGHHVRRRRSSARPQDYDLRRLEYTMSGVSGEGRKADIDDSLWSPTQEGLQVGIDLTVWHHLDPRAGRLDPPEDRPGLRGEDHPPGGALGDPPGDLGVRGDGRLLVEARARSRTRSTARSRR